MTAPASTAAHACEYLVRPADCVINGPKASCLPPKYSATIAAITASDVDSLRAVKKKGMALGIRTSRAMVHLLAAYDAINSIWLGFPCLRPFDVLMNIGKNRSKATIA